MWEGIAMNTEQANSIELYLILNKLGINPIRQNGFDYWYLSPFRNEKEASFHLNLKKNIWYDFGEEKGGTVIDFVQAYLEKQGEDHTVQDALRWLDNMTPAQSDLLKSIQLELSEEALSLSLKEKGPIEHFSLIKYLHVRGIPFGLARKYLKQVLVCNHKTGKNFHCLAFRNEEGGYELRNEFFKSCHREKTISFFRGAKVLSGEVHVFEGFMDFLSVLAFKNVARLDGDVIVLNSTNCISHAIGYMNNYGYETMYSWMDNDATGEKATTTLTCFARGQQNLTHKPMNKLYASYKDVNDWRMKALGLSF